MTDEELAMIYVIEKLAPDPASVVTGTTLFLASRGDYPGVHVRVDWPEFLGTDTETIEAAVASRVACYRAESLADEESQRRSALTKAGIARRKAAGLPVGRQPGAADKKPRKRSGYVARWERERAAS